VRVAWVVALAACTGGSPAPAPAGKVAAQPLVAHVDAKRHGQVLTKSFASASLGVDKEYVIYLPAGYDAQPEMRWPVFYYLHGLGGNERNWVDGGALDATADTIGLDAIVVMPDGDDSFYVDAIEQIDYDACMRDGTGLFIQGRNAKRKTCVRKRDYATYITKDLIEHVDATYRTIASRDGRAIAGLSMGGFGAFQLSLRHPDLYAAAASHSGVISLLYGGPPAYEAGKVETLTDPRQWGGPFVEIKRWMLGLLGEDIARWRALDPAALIGNVEPGKPALYFDCGTEDGFALQNHASHLHDLLQARHVEHEFFLGKGKHDFAFWRPRVAESLRFLRSHTTKPHS
jgi:putative tributyrin esterase